MQEKRFGEGNSGSPSLLGFRNSDKSGQVTIFIIVAVLVVAGIVLYFVLNSDSSETEQSVSGDQEIQSPEGFLRSCVEDKARESLNTLFYGGGYLSEPPGSVEFKLEGSQGPRNAPLLCGPSGSSTCTNKEPILQEHINSEIKEDLKPKVESCWDNLVGNYGDGAKIEDSYNGFDLGFDYLGLNMYINSSAKIEKGGSSTRLKNPEMEFSTDLYRIVEIVEQVVEGESSSCDFEYRGHNILYPKYQIDIPVVTTDGSKIYSVESEKSGERFIFAVRSCVADA